jgi:hypothetical protein
MLQPLDSESSCQRVTFRDCFAGFFALADKLLISFLFWSGHWLEQTFRVILCVAILNSKLSSFAGAVVVMLMSLRSGVQVGDFVDHFHNCLIRSHCSREVLSLS